MLEELVAQVVEEVSVLAADHRRKKPRTVPRPWREANAEPEMNGHQQLLAAATAGGSVRYG